jgi:hypothetical protein
MKGHLFRYPSNIFALAIVLKKESRMGTGKVQRDKIPEIIKEFDAFERRIWPIMGGDDALFDYFIRARRRMEQLADPSYTGWGPDGRSPVGYC